MRRFVVSSEELDRQDSIGLLAAADKLFEDTETTAVKARRSLIVEQVPDSEPYFFKHDHFDWADHAINFARNSPLTAWYDDADLDDAEEYIAELTVYTSSLPWLYESKTDIHEIKSDPRDLVVLLGIGAVELYERHPYIFEEHHAAYASKLAMAQHVSAMMVQKREWLGVDRGWLYSESFFESLTTPSSVGELSSLSVGTFNANDPKLAVHRYNWFREGSITPYLNDVVSFSPKVCEAQIYIDHYAQTSEILTNVMAFLDYAKIPDSVQAVLVQSAVNRAHARTSSVALPLFAEGMSDNDEVRGDVRNLLSWRQPDAALGIQEMPHGGIWPGGASLAGHDTFMLGAYNDSDADKRVIIRFDEDSEGHMMQLVLLELDNEGALQPVRQIAIRPHETSQLVECLLLVNQKTSQQSSPRIFQELLKSRYGIDIHTDQK